MPAETGGRQVVAVVVTYNRAELLRRLLWALHAQTRAPDQVIVVDNASTDDTAAVLHQIADETGLDLTVLTLSRNTGGAGGFDAGSRAAVEAGADLVWMMDDDGLPEETSLERLLPYADRLDFWGPAVVDEQNPTRLCFPIRLPGRARVVHELADVEAAAPAGVLGDVVIPFNGVLISAELMRRIGYVRAEFFIWGDDVEYLWRAKRAGARIGTVVAVHFAHPATDDLGTPMMAGATTYNHSASDLKHYCLVRNNSVNLAQYVGWRGVAAFAVKTLWFYTVTRPSPSRLRLSAGAFAAALRGDFTGHERFLE